MKVKYLFVASAILALSLSGCRHSNNQSSDNKEDTKQEANHKGNNTSEKQNSNEGFSEKNSGNDNFKSEKSAHNVKSFNQLTNKDKIALAMFEVGHSKYAETAVSAEELLNHSYTKLDNTDKVQKSIQTIKFQRTFDGQVPGQPSNMDVYETYQSKGNYLMMMAMTDSQMIIMPEKGTNTYQQLLDYGAIYNLKNLYEKYKNNPNFSKVVNMISVSETPETGSSNNSASHSESHSSTSEGKVTRANVIDKVEEYEGHQLDTSTYTYKEPEQLDGGKWGFSFVDKSGDLAGSYIVNADGSVEKFDSKGQPE
ncbi:hypothetical protein BU035_05515 [Staphylococcus simulans]|uniref:hypothetical protein n=1 Tax=Staphylococcus simulans TaxID=1286 RepID=UPI000D1EA7E6|nr:hypothetical protein [Staphylococcus simulans]PTJ27984.1 hypothetical protein BU035_05515 [Staphylococcus simulans]VED61447.1 lipoprotein [Staphylococcus simulans]